MLRELKIPVKSSIQKSHVDTEITCNLVDILFKHVLMSIQHDRSSVKLNALTRGVIGGVLGNTRDGTKDYLMGMRNEDLNILLDDMEKELSKRKRSQIR